MVHGGRAVGRAFDRESLGREALEKASHKFLAGRIIAGTR
jgi:hypothetical protein